MDALVPSHKLDPADISKRTSALWWFSNRMKLEGVRPTKQALAELYSLFGHSPSRKGRCSSLLQCSTPFHHQLVYQLCQLSTGVYVCVLLLLL